MLVSSIPNDPSLKSQCSGLLAHFQCVQWGNAQRRERVRSTVPRVWAPAHPSVARGRRRRPSRERRRRRRGAVGTRAAAWRRGATAWARRRWSRRVGSTRARGRRGTGRGGWRSRRGGPGAPPRSRGSSAAAEAPGHPPRRPSSGSGRRRRWRTWRRRVGGSGGEGRSGGWRRRMGMAWARRRPSGSFPLYTSGGFGHLDSSAFRAVSRVCGSVGQVGATTIGDWVIATWQKIEVLCVCRHLYTTKSQPKDFVGSRHAQPRLLDHTYRRPRSSEMWQFCKRPLKSHWNPNRHPPRRLLLPSPPCRSTPPHRWQATSSGGGASPSSSSARIA
jgi:hypothetical protein